MNWSTKDWIEVKYNGYFAMITVRIIIEAEGSRLIIDHKAFFH